MTGYFIRRLLWIIPVLWAITLITFILMHTVQGGPFDQGQGKSSEAGRQALIAKYHLDKPVYVQYVYYMRNLIKGDMGPDLVNPGLTVNDILKRSWKPTFTLGLLASGYVVVVGMTLGVVAAINKNTIIDYASVGFATIGAS